MKILIVTQHFYPSIMGGPANTLYWLSKALNKVGYEVMVSTTKVGIIDDQSSDSLKFQKISVRYLRNWFYSFFDSAVKLFSSNVIILGSIFYKPTFPLALIASLFRKKIIWSPRGELFDEALSNRKIKKIYIKIINKILRNNIIFHATSKEEELAIQKYFGKVKIFVIPNLIEMPPILSKKNNTAKYILYMGRIAPIKALDHLLEALTLSKSFLNSNCILKIAGPIDDISYFHKLNDYLNSQDVLKSKVEFLGPISGNKKNILYANASALVLVSYSENFGNVVLESLVQGTPVIASTGTPWQILEESQAGYWITNSPESIAQAIDKLLSLNDIEYNTMAKAASDLAKSYDIYENIHKWNRILKDEKED